jgi:pantoate--beta-alanine ligase
LIHQSKEQNGITVCSIFVNPTQFNNKSDFDKYPTSLDEDILALEAAGCDILFLPSVQEIYPDGLNALTHYDLGHLETILEGEYRPGHFQGVCNVVDRLLGMVSPDNLYLGQKDYQQCKVISRMIDLRYHEHKPVLKLGATLREADGLAMSSRNRRLTPEQRAKAPAIFQELTSIANQLVPGNLRIITQQAEDNLEQKGFKVDYIEIASPVDLQLKEDWDGSGSLVILAAAYLDEIRLIDNIIVKK